MAHAKERGGARVMEVHAEYEIANFVATCAVSKTISEGKSDCREIVSGPILAAGNYKFGIAVAWSIVEKNGMVDESKNLGVHVRRLDDQADECTMCLEMTVINRKGISHVTLSEPNYHGIRSGKARGWSRSFDMPDRRRHEGVKGLPLSDVFDNESGWLHSGALRVSAKINVVVGQESGPATVSPSRPASQGLQELSECLQDLLQSGRHADVTIKVGDERIAAHFVILAARSPFFAAAFSCPMLESTRREVVLEDLEPSAVHALLHYFYTGSVTNQVLEDNDQCMALLSASHRLEVPSLVHRCIKAVSSRLDVENVADCLQVADLIGSAALKAQCLDFIQTRMGDVQLTDGYTRLVHQRPALLKDIIEVIQPPSKRRKTKGKSA